MPHTPTSVGTYRARPPLSHIHWTESCQECTALWRSKREALQRMRSGGFGMRPDNTPLTASVGIAERAADQVLEWKMLVDLADRRMYLAKQGGRDRVVSTQGEE